MRAIAACALLALAVACGAPEDDPHAVRWLDPGRFAAEVQPVLAERCGNPSCHGRVERPFVVYSPRGLRADPERTWIDEPLTAEELEDNYTSACVFASEAARPADTLLLRKPLAQHAGTHHEGGAVFAGTADRQWRTLLGWVEAGWE